MTGRRPEVKAVGEQLCADAARWRDAYEGWQVVVRRSRLELARAERKVTAATGGLGVARWRAACRRARILTVQDAKLRARALRARPAVEAALTERERVAAEGHKAVLAAQLALAEASRRVAAYGPLATGLTGLSPVELGRLAREPDVMTPLGERARSSEGEVPTPTA